MGKGYERQQRLLFLWCRLYSFHPPGAPCAGGGVVGKGVHHLRQPCPNPGLCSATRPLEPPPQLSPYVPQSLAAFEIQLRSQCLQEAFWPIPPPDLSQHVISFFFF